MCVLTVVTAVGIAVCSTLSLAAQFESGTFTQDSVLERFTVMKLLCTGIFVRIVHVLVYMSIMYAHRLHLCTKTLNYAQPLIAYISNLHVRT